MAGELRFELVAPERLLLDLPVRMVTLPGAEGDMGILPGHAPLITGLRPGVLLVDAAEGEERILVGGGVAEIALDRLTVLAEEAINVKELDRARLDRMLKDAEEDLVDARDEGARTRAEARLAYLRLMRAAAG
ncbi:MAG: ATP synthase F1 subunit epsilon [Alphaproteobacteria bacterium]|nr:ATP synthase F1 subunit epsilon [Alphaproteobacteria bacterium]